MVVESERESTRGGRPGGGNVILLTSTLKEMDSGTVLPASLFELGWMLDRVFQPRYVELLGPVSSSTVPFICCADSHSVLSCPAPTYAATPLLIKERLTETLIRCRMLTGPRIDLPIPFCPPFSLLPIYLSIFTLTAGPTTFATALLSHALHSAAATPTTPSSTRSTTMNAKPLSARESYTSSPNPSDLNRQRRILFSTIQAGRRCEGMGRSAI
jgi:hypothetical protein